MLSSFGKNVLLILDNIDNIMDYDEEYDSNFFDTIGEIVEKVPKVKILVSGTTYPKIFSGNFTLHKLQKLTIEESVQLFINKIPEQQILYT